MAKAMVLKRGTLMPIAWAAISLSRMAMKARRGRRGTRQIGAGEAQGRYSPSETNDSGKGPGNRDRGPEGPAVVHHEDGGGITPGSHEGAVAQGDLAVIARAQGQA